MAASRGAPAASANDLTAAVLLRFFERDVFTEFVFQSKEKFDGWLHTVVEHAVFTFLRDRRRTPEAWSVGHVHAQKSLDQVQDEMRRDLGSICEEERVLLQTARARVEKRIEGKTREVFALLTDQRRTVEEVTQQLNMTKFAVWKARSRVLRMLRQEVALLNGHVREEE